MRRIRLVPGALILAAAMIAALAPAAEAGPNSRGAFVVGFKNLPRDLRSGDQFHGARVERVDPVLEFARVRASNAGAFRAQAAQDNRVRYVEPDPVMKLIEFTPNDTQYPQQYGPQHIRAPEAWDTTLGDTDAAVCVADTGVRYTHEDLAGSRWKGGYDFINGDADPADDNGHGTHVAGSAAAWINNAKGIAGVGNVALYGVKVLNAQGFGSWSQVASGIRWCADNGGPRVVINMSLGGDPATVLQDAVTYAYGKGALLVAAAGNGGPCSNCVEYPANYAEVIAVTCTTSTKAQCSFSSDGPDSELAGPGQLIRSTWPFTPEGDFSDTSYNTISGTSMSTPHVAGAAALVWSHATGVTNTQLRQHLRDEAQDLGPSGWDQQFGYGLVDAKATLDAVSGPPPPEARLTFEDFDDGMAQGWILGGLWHISSACSTPPSVPNYLGYNQDSDCQYSTGARTKGSATFDVDLTGKTQATLNLAHRFEKEIGGFHDALRIRVSTNGGINWTTLRQWDSRNPNQLAWTNHTVDLDPYTGGAIKLQFNFDSIDAGSNNYAGWFLDNVEVTAGPVEDTRLTFENFDDGVAQGWSLAGLWHVSSACSTPPSAPNYLGYNEDSDCQYSTGARTKGSASFDVNLSGKTEATLNFDHRFEKESRTGTFDAMQVKVSTNGGGTFTTLRQWDSRNPNQLAWTNHSVDLDPYTGGTVKLRFYFDSVDAASNNYAGWFLDNVEVTAQ